MAKKPLAKNHPKLHKECEEVTKKELRTKEFQKILDEMLDIVYGRNNKGANHDKSRPMTVGLSANQIGIMKRISIVDLAIGHKGYSDIHILINPKITWHSKSLSKHDEGCVNLPEIWGSVPRYKEVEVEALDRSGNEITIRAKGWTSVLLQHEIDHLNGYLFIDRLEDPSKAHYVKKDNMVEYRKFRRKKMEWPEYIDVRDLTRQHVNP